MESSPPQSLANTCRRYSMFALRSQLSLSFFWFGSAEQRLAIVPNRWATMSPGLAALGGGSSQAVDRLKHFPVAGLTMPAWPKLAAKDAFAFRLAGSAFAAPLSPPLSPVSTQPLPVGAIRTSGVPVEVVFISPEIVALVPQEELAGARVFILDPGQDVIPRRSQTGPISSTPRRSTSPETSARFPPTSPSRSIRRRRRSAPSRSPRTTPLPREQRWATPSR